MRTDEVKARGADLLRKADEYARANPIPALCGAVALGFAIGLISRSLEKPPEPAPIRDALRELRSMLNPLARKTRGVYADSSGAVREALDKAHELDTTSLSRWWKRLWV